MSRKHYEIKYKNRNSDVMTAGVMAVTSEQAVEMVEAIHHAKSIVSVKEIDTKTFRSLEEHLR